VVLAAARVIVAGPLSFVAVVPSYEFGFISKDDVFDAFFG
jgi:hypothetical protein